MLGLGNSLSGGFMVGGSASFSLKLDGTDDHMLIAHNASLKPTTGITVSCWVNLDLAHGATGWVNPDGNNDNDQYIVGSIASGGYGIYISYSGTANNPRTHIQALLNVTDDGDGNPGYLNANWGGVTSTTGATVLHEIKDFSGWVHLAMTYDGAVLKLYINANNDLNEGDVDTSDNQLTDSGVTGKSVRYTIDTPLFIGSDSVNASDSAQFPFAGLIDDVAVWSAGIDSDGITTIYNSGKAGLNLLDASGNYDNQADLEGWWKFEEGTGTSVADSSSNSNTGTLVNSPSFSNNTSE